MSENKEQEFPKSEQALKEEKIINFWDENNIFKKSIEQRNNKKDFVFYDGPPFATGLPHYGHVIPGTLKDVFPRYKTMRGYRVERNWGWDCHGMPIENIVEKKLGLKSKKDIEEFGILEFTKEAKKSIFTFKEEWEEIIPQTGRWVDMQNHYKTMDVSFMESEWWAFSEIHKQGYVSEDFKSMHICPRCETTLSNRDVSEEYADLKDLSLTAKFKVKGKDKTFILAWTTTPWTLPGNVALAVNKEMTYVVAENESGEKYIFAKDLYETISQKSEEELKITEEMTGEDLIGWEYEPLFDYYLNADLKNKENGWKVYDANFVTAEDGTGIVHIAPAFGEDDLELGRKHKLPWIQHVAINGEFTPEITDFAGMKVRKKEFHEEVDIEIIKKLAHENKLFAKEKFEHSYPLCWRCKTPLLNYATSSWFIDVPQVREKMAEANKTIGWVPDFLGHKRFQHWLEGAKPWAVSRQRFWGTPIPIWRNVDNKEDFQVIGSINELKEKTKSDNKYFVVRHGKSEANENDNISCAVGQFGDRLLPEGIKQLENIRDSIDVDIIISSPFERTKQTAEILNKNKEVEIIFDDRIKEINFGDLNGNKNELFLNKLNSSKFNINDVFENGESILDVKKRVMDFLYDIDKKYNNKKILIVTHDGIISMLKAGIQGLDLEESLEFFRKDHNDNASLTELDFAPIPHDEDYTLDLHRPFIDEISWEENGSKYKYIREVFDTWFDSGSMPFASKHYPFNEEEFNPDKNLRYPADFIAEAQDQTRGWFYVLLVINYILFNKAPFKNVVASGMLMAEDGKKMSKSLKNYPPMEKILNVYGGDALRLFLLTSTVVRGDSPAFSEKEVGELYRKVILRTQNIMSFYDLYEKNIQLVDAKESKNILDKWIIERTEKLLIEVTNALENYKVDEATRPIIDYVDDLSTWYIRRSRNRFKGDEGEQEQIWAISTTNYVMKLFAQFIAPMMPFLSEMLWIHFKSEEDVISVHLSDWPEVKDGLLEKIFKKDHINLMDDVRAIVSKGLEARAISGFKVRQPLSKAVVVGVSDNVIHNEDIYSIIQDELNIKKVYLFPKIEDITEEIDNHLKEELIKNSDEQDNLSIVIDTKLTPELIQEGNFREFIRIVQTLRKKKGLSIDDKIELKVDLKDGDNSFIEDNIEELQKLANVMNINYAELDDINFKINNHEIGIVIVS